MVVDVGGNPIEVWADNGEVWLLAWNVLALSPAKREEFAQAWVAACHAADRQAVTSDG